MIATTRLLESPDVPAASVDDLKALLKLDPDGEEYNSEDQFLTSLLMAASDYAVNFLNRTLISSVWIRQYTEKLRQYPGLAVEVKMLQQFILPYPPVNSVEAIKKIAADGTEIVITSYVLDKVSEPALLRPDICLGNNERLYIEYEAGFGDNYNSVPSAIQQGILQHAAYMYNHRGDCNAEDSARASGATMIYGMWRIPAL